ncbi:MAG: helix-turn-helix domain-containing protein [Pirellulales bacterium]
MSVSAYNERYERFRTLLVETRKTRGLTQVEVARRLGKPQSFVSKYERGERRLDVVEFLDVAKALGVAPRRLLERLEPEQP